MKRGNALLLPLLALLPGGCVAAAIPIAAGGLIAKSQVDGDAERAPRTAASTPLPAADAEETSGEEVALASAPEPTPAPTPAPAARPGPSPSGEESAALAPAPAASPAPASGNDAASLAQRPASPASSVGPDYDPRGAPPEFVAFAEHALALNAAEGAQPTALLADPASLEPERTTCANKPPAVLIDLDPGDGLASIERPPERAPALAHQLETLRENGVAVFWITDHTAQEAGKIRRRLFQAGLDTRASDPLLVRRYPDERKQPRRRALADTHCLLAIAGQEREDFDELYVHVLDQSRTRPLDEMIGDGWFITPNPLD